MHYRLNITLPEETVRLVDRLTSKGDRSRFIDEAIRYFAETRRRASMRKRLRQGALRRSERDLALSADWFGLEEESWPGRK